MAAPAVAEDAVKQPSGVIVVVADLQVMAVGFRCQAVAVVVLVTGDVALVVGFSFDVAGRVECPGQADVLAAVGFAL